MLDFVLAHCSRSITSDPGHGRYCQVSIRHLDNRNTNSETWSGDPSGQMGRTDNNGLATLERIGSPGSIGETENDGLCKSGT